MKLEQYGYRAEKKTHAHTLTMGELKILICQKLIKAQLQSAKIRIVQCNMGEVDEYQNMNEFMLHEHNNSFELLVYDIRVQHISETQEDYLIAIVAEDTVEVQ